MWMRSILLNGALATALAATMPAAQALPRPAVSPEPVVKAQALCGALGNCGYGTNGSSTLPQHTIVPDIGRFDPGHDNRFGRYRYEQPDQQIDTAVPRMRATPRVGSQPRYSGPRTIYRVGKLSGEHVDWCFERYKSYRARDNTYQPNEGPRKTCVSPFSK